MVTNTRENRYILTAEDRTRQAFDALQKRFNETQRSLNLLRNLTAGAFSVAGLVAFVNKVAEAERAQNRLTAVINAQGHAAGFTRQQLDSMGDALARATEFDDEAFASAQAELIKFGDIYGEVFERALKLSADLASFQGTDLLSATQIVGRALQSPLNSLKGFEQQLGKLDSAQKQQLKTAVEQNRTLDAQNRLLDILQGKIGGTAALMNTGFNGAIKGVTESFDDLLEAMGKTEAVQTTVLGFFGALEQSMRDLKSIIDAGDWFGGLLFMLGFRGHELGRSSIIASEILMLERNLEDQRRKAAESTDPVFDKNIVELERRIEILRKEYAALIEVSKPVAPPALTGGEPVIVSTKQFAIPAPPSPAGANVLGIDAGFFNEQFRQAAGLTADDRANLLGIGPDFLAAAEKAQAFAENDLRLLHERQAAQLVVNKAADDYLKNLDLESNLMAGTVREKQAIQDEFELERLGLERTTEEWRRYMTQVSAVRDLQERRRASFLFGVRGGIDTVLDDVVDVAQKSHDLVVDAFSGMEDAIIEFVKTGKLEFSDLADQIVSDLLRIAIQASITAPLARMFGSFNFGLPGGTVDVPPAAVGFQHGGSFRIGGSGGPDSQFVPFWGTPGEMVTVSTPQQMKGGVTVNVINQSGAAVEAEQAGPPRFDGEQWVVDVLLKQLSRNARLREQTRRMLSAPR